MDALTGVLIVAVGVLLLALGLVVYGTMSIRR